MQSYSSSSATTTKLTTPQPLYKPLSSDAIRASVTHLLTKAFSLPCSTGAQAFAQLVQPTARFQLALDALLPILDSDSSTEVRGDCLDFVISIGVKHINLSCPSGFSFHSSSTLSMHLTLSPSTPLNQHYLWCMLKNVRRLSALQAKEE